jgi:hypothetical protein
VNENGGKLQGNNSVGLNQMDGVIAATKVTLTQPSTCAAIFAHSGSGSGQCANVEHLQPPQPPLVPDLEHSAVCVLPSPFPKCSSNAVTVNAGDVRMLAAGTYGDLTINGGSLVLQGGQYVFCNVNVNNGSVVVAGAPSTVLVTDRFNVEPDALVNATGSPTDLHVLVNGLGVNISGSSGAGVVFVNEAAASTVGIASQAPLLCRFGGLRSFSPRTTVVAQLCAPQKNAQMNLLGPNLVGTFVADTINIGTSRGLSNP